MDTINRFLSKLSNRRDLVLVAILLTAVVVMIVPIPTGVVDILIATNIALTILVLIVSVYLDRATSFSTLPAVLLIATVFRLAISISTTRTILTLGEGGAIIETFGTFVTGGNIVVGLVVFLIITIVQFVVITKGAERVAEVAARFVLDAMPGRQLSIDAELRAGDLNPEEARARRRQLDKENQFFGAMDGAMKFVKGDAIAGLLIVAVNLIGGIAIGTSQLGMSMADASQTFSLLTIGDGLVAQIPALLIALCAGAVVTRVSTDASNDLGSDIFMELTTSSKTLMLTAVVTVLLGLVPGFPTLVFLGLGALFAFASYSKTRPRYEEAGRRAGDPMDWDAPEPAAPQLMSGGEASVSSGYIFEIRVGMRLASRIDGAAFTEARDRERKQMSRRLGIRVGAFDLRTDDTLPENGFALLLDDVALLSGSIPTDAVAAEADGVTLDILGIARTPVPESWRLKRVSFAREADRSELAKAQIPVLPEAELLVRLAIRVIAAHLGQIAGFEDIASMLDQAKKETPRLFEQVTIALPVPKIHDIFRRLISENVPLTPLRLIFEALMEWAQRETDSAILAEHARRGMRRQICSQFADANRQIAAYVIEPDLEAILRTGLRTTEAGVFLSLAGRNAELFLRAIEQIPEPTDPVVPDPVILTTVDLRRHVQAYLKGQNLSFAVLSFQEIAPEFTVLPVGSLNTGEADPLQRVA